MDHDKAVSKALSYIGFAAASGRLTAGTDTVLDEVRRASRRGVQADIIVFLAKDASERTKKQIRDKCSFYGVSLIEAAKSYALSDAAGKKCALSAVCVTDRNLARAVRRALGEGADS